MTEQELIELVRTAVPEELSGEQIEALRQALAHSEPLREALSQRLEMEQYLGHVLGRVEISIDRIVERAAQMPAQNPATRLIYWGLAMLVLLAGGVVLYWNSRSLEPEQPIAQRADTVGQPPTRSPESAAPAEEPEPPGEQPAAPAEPPAMESSAKALADAASRPVAQGADPAPPAQTVAAPQPWDNLIAAADAAPAFEDVCFEDFSQADALRSIELGNWLEQVPGHAISIREQLPACIFDGVARLKSPWRDDLALRLALWDHHGLRIHFWAGQRGVTLWYYQYPPTWVAYQTTRDSDQPQPKTYALAAQDEQRFGRTSQGAFELRYAHGRLYMTRGDLLLLSAALPQPPSEVYLEGHANIRGIALSRSAGVPPAPEPRPAVIASNEPAKLQWKSQFAEEAGLHNHSDGSVELTADKTKNWSTLALPYPTTGIYEVIFQVIDPQPGTGVFLGDEQGQPQHMVRFLRDTRTGHTSVGFLSPGDRRFEGNEDISQRPAPYALRRHWIKLVLGCGTVKNYVSDDGVHFTRGDSPLQTSGALRPCSTLGIYCVPGDEPRRIRLASVEVRQFSAMARLLPPELESKALGQVGDGKWSLAQWMAQVIDSQPPEVEAGAWRRACAVKSLRAGPSAELGMKLLLGLVDEVLAQDVPATDPRQLLEEAALLAPTWNYDSRQTAVELARRYEMFGRRLAQQGVTRPYTAISGALLAAPIDSTSALPMFPESLLRHELLNLVQNEQWQEAIEVCRRAEFWNRPAAPGQRVFARESIAGLVEWARATAARRAPDREGLPSAALRGDWRHPLVEVLSKEGYNILAEFNAALEGEAYADACQIISSTDPQSALGLLPDAKDNRLLVSLPAAVSLAMREHSKLRQAMNEQFGARGQLRVRQAIGEGNLVALEAATMQFCGTPAAAEAHLWLGDRAMAAGDFLHAIGQYRQALAGKLQRGTVEPRLRLAAAMLGRDEGLPVREPVTLNGEQYTPEEFEALVAEMLTRASKDPADSPVLESNATAYDQTPPPSHYQTDTWARFDGDHGREPQQTPYPALDFAGRQLAAVVSGGRMLVSNRFQVVAYELSSGKQQWATRLDNQHGRTHSWPLAPMRPVVSGQRVYVRRLTNHGPELACLRLEDGKVLWTARPGDHVASDPLLVQDQLLALCLAGTQDGYLQLLLAAFDPRTGEVLFQHPLMQLRDVWSRQAPCQAITLDDQIIATVGGSVLCCDLLGEVRWLRRQTWLPRDLDNDWEQQYVQPPLERDGLLYIAQQGVRVVECLEAGTGRLRWQQTLPDVCRLCGIAAGNLIVETAAGLEAFDAFDGERVWHRPMELLTGQLCGEEQLLVVQREHLTNDLSRPALVWIDAATGRMYGRCPLSKLCTKWAMLGPLVSHDDKLWAFHAPEDREPLRDIVLLKRTGSVTTGLVQNEPLRYWPLKVNDQLDRSAFAFTQEWVLLAARADKHSHLYDELNGEEGVLVTSAEIDYPSRFVRLLDLPAGSRSKLVLKVGYKPGHNWGLDVRVGGDSVLSQTIDQSAVRDGWKELTVDLTPYAGRPQWLTVMHRHFDKKYSHALWKRLDVLSEPEMPSDPPHGGE